MTEETMILELTAEVVAAYVAKNPVPISGIPDLVASVSASIGGLGKPSAPSAPVPAVSPKKSIFADHLVCLEDGKKFKSMKRHLSKLGLTPDEYRAKWGLAKDYPMVAPNYAAQRSDLAKKLGLGRKPAPPKAAPAAKAKPAGKNPQKTTARKRSAKA